MKLSDKQRSWILYHMAERVRAEIHTAFVEICGTGDAAVMAVNLMLEEEAKKLDAKAAKLAKGSRWP